MKSAKQSVGRSVGKYIAVVLVILGIGLYSEPMAAQRGARTTGSSGTAQGKNPESIMKINKRTAIPYKAFAIDELNDPSTGKKLTSTDKITFKDRSTISATEYLDQINKLEKEFNALGYSLRGESETVVLQQATVPESELESQASTLRSSIVSSAKFAPMRTRSYTGEKVGTSKVKTMPSSGSSIISPRDPASGDVKRSASASTSSASKSSPTATVTTTYTSKEKSWDSKVLGKKELFGVNLTADAKLEGRSDKYYASIAGAAKLYVLSNSFDAISASASATSPLKDGVDAEIKLNINVLGANVYNYSQSKDVTWSISDSKGKSFDKGYSFDCTIGPIPVSVTLGAEGSAYYNYELGIMPTKAYGEAGMTVEAKAYGQAGVGVKYINAGVGTEFVIISYNNTVNGAIEVDLAGETPSFEQDFSLCHSLTALDGSVYAYVKVFNKEYRYEFFDWDGISTEGCLW
jgi:hypothetical protein